MNGATHRARPVARQVTADLLARYDRSGPRYTSYPTAVEFSDELDTSAYERLLAQADRRESEPLSVYIHLPFCAARCLFCACHVIITPDAQRARPYLDLLAREVDLLAERLPRRRTVSQLHLGGGTPTFHDPQDLDDLVRHFMSSFSIAAGAELAVEVDPRVTTPAHLEVLGALGFNRLSIGVQDFAPEVQEAVARVQTEEETARIIECARSVGFRGVNVDLIYGLPHQTPDAFERTVEIVIGLGVDRVAVYSFAFVPWVRRHQDRLRNDLPARRQKLSLFSVARERLLEAGYEPIGMDHFARSTDELSIARREGRLRRNFQGYTVVPAEDVVGLGISAIGDVRGAYVQNQKKLGDYGASVRAGRLPVERGVVRTGDDEIRRSIIHELMCNFRIDVASVEQRYEIAFGEYFREEIGRLQAHAREGLVDIAPERIEATPTGELFVRNLAMCFDRYWREKHEVGGRPVFSRTV